MGEISDRVMSRSICIVTPGYISTTPRVVKEADALSNAGYDVRVVFAQGDLEDVRHYDSLLLKEKKWRNSVVQWSRTRKGESFLFHKTRLRHYFFKKAPRFLSGVWRFAEYGEGRIYKELVRLASVERADLYIGHYPTGLAAAAEVTSRWKTKFGYDIEDFHIGEGAAEGADLSQLRRIETIEKRYLSKCAHLTAVSDLVADEINRHYHVQRPLPLYNVFPWEDRFGIDNQVKDRKGDALSLCWFSQVIGEGRGIEDVIKAAGLLCYRVQIHLRGHISQEIKKKLVNLAEESNIAQDLYFHELVPPGELLSRVAEHDVGLAPEQPNSLNHQLTVSNKLFLYLLAGLAVAATDVPGQRSVMSTCAEAGFLYPPGDYHTLAARLKELITDSSRLRVHKTAALEAARDQWNWERESQKLVRKIREVI